MVVGNNVPSSLEVPQGTTENGNFQIDLPGRVTANTETEPKEVVGNNDLSSLEGPQGTTENGNFQIGESLPIQKQNQQRCVYNAVLRQRLCSFLIATMYFSN
jgi:hypothetical protein